MKPIFEVLEQRISDLDESRVDEQEAVEYLVSQTQYNEDEVRKALTHLTARGWIYSVDDCIYVTEHEPPGSYSYE